MSGHLPECGASDYPNDHEFWCCESCDGTPAPWERPDCICAALRACEQRVRNDEHRALITHGAKTYLAGYRDGVLEAREAVAALDACPECAIDDALDAIDNLNIEQEPKEHSHER